MGEAIVQVDLLSQPTFSGMKIALKRAKNAGKPYKIVHFDGYGVYDKRRGLAVLGFELLQDNSNLRRRQIGWKSSTELARELKNFGVTLAFLEAFGKSTEKTLTASLAVKLVEEGVGSVVAMSHPVLLETAYRFVERFYICLAEGKRVGDAMLAGQEALYGDPYRFKVIGAGNLELQDWFVPVLYQDEADPQLFTVTVGEAAARLARERRQKQLGQLPPEPEHHFVGRSHQLLYLERLLQQEPYAVIRGSGGLGKTALATELARWLVQSSRFQRAAFVNVEPQSVLDVREVLDVIGCQLVPGYLVVHYGDDLIAALQPIERALRDFPTVIVLDNMESVLPDSEGNNPAGVADVTELLALCQKLLASAPRCRLLFTSREPLPAPFAKAKCTVELGRLSEPEAIQLVEQVMAQHGWEPPASDNATTPAEITELVETVNRHPRALVLLAREVAEGIQATTRNVVWLMAKLEADNPGDRENSLYASVELSLQRLPEDVRQRVNRLAVVHSGANKFLLRHLMEIDCNQTEIVTNLQVDITSNLLVEVGMAEQREYTYLRLDPALSAYLKLRHSSEQIVQLTAIWGEAMLQLVDFLFDQLFKDSTMALRLTLLELPNLIALLGWLGQRLKTDTAIAELVVNTSGEIEQLLANLNRPQALGRAVALRERAAAAISEWGKARFENERLQIERLLGREQLQVAFGQAQDLLAKAQAVGPTAYPGADYDLAMAYVLLGQVLKTAGQAAPALELLVTAQQQFESLGKRGERIASLTLSESANCLKELGRLDEAAARYEQSIEQAKILKNSRLVAMGIMGLSSVQLIQGRYEEAISGYSEVCSFFEQQNELATLATVWHQIGLTYQKAGNHDASETAYCKALQLNTYCNNRIGAAKSLTELGKLYDTQLRLEEAVTFYREAADIFVVQGDLQSEGVVRNNIADTLYKLQRYDEARGEIRRAIIECKQHFGHAATPWTSFNILHNIETATGNPAAARAAWQQARDAYLAYRQQGGYAQFGGGQLVDHVLGLLAQQQVDEVQSLFQQLTSDPNTSDTLKQLIQAMVAILNGSRDPALADDPALNYADAAEVLFLLHRLQPPPP